MQGLGDKRSLRLAALPHCGIYEIIQLKLLTREDWIEVAGAVYPSNTKDWKRLKTGRVKFVGKVPHADELRKETGNEKEEFGS